MPHPGSLLKSLLIYGTSLATSGVFANQKGIEDSKIAMRQFSLHKTTGVLNFTGGTSKIEVIYITSTISASNEF